MNANDILRIIKKVLLFLLVWKVISVIFGLITITMFIEDHNRIGDTLASFIGIFIAEAISIIVLLKLINSKKE